jgi:hypothetical protein
MFRPAYIIEIGPYLCRFKAFDIRPMTTESPVFETAALLLHSHVLTYKYEQVSKQKLSEQELVKLVVDLHWYPEPIWHAACTSFAQM